MLTKLFAALMTVMLCLGFTPTPTTQTEPAAPAKNNTVIEASTGIPQPTTTVLLTAQEAEDIALERAALTREAVTFSRTEFDRDNGRPEWEVECRSGDWEYDCTVHAETGRVLEWEKEYDPEKPTASQPAVTEPPVTEPPAGQLTKVAAQAIALKHAGLTADQVTRLKVTFDYDDGTAQFEVEFRHGSWEYEYDIHGETGAILDWEKDYDD